MAQARRASRGPRGSDTGFSVCSVPARVQTFGGGEGGPGPVRQQRATRHGRVSERPPTPPPQRGTGLASDDVSACSAFGSRALSLGFPDSGVPGAPDATGGRAGREGAAQAGAGAWAGGSERPSSSPAVSVDGCAPAARVARGHSRGRHAAAGHLPRGAPACPAASGGLQSAPHPPRAPLPSPPGQRGLSECRLWGLRSCTGRLTGAAAEPCGFGF